MELNNSEIILSWRLILDGNNALAYFYSYGETISIYHIEEFNSKQEGFTYIEENQIIFPYTEINEQLYVA